MAELLNRCRSLAQGAPFVPRAERREEAIQRKPARAWRNWRVILDKVATLLLFSQLQGVVEEWYPLSQPLHALLPQPEQEPRTLKEVYAAIIRNAKPMAPIKGKSTPKVSVSTCIHPTARLSGGGNESISWITCMDCHARWESVTRATELRKSLKAEGGGGLPKSGPAGNQKAGILPRGKESHTAAALPGPSRGTSATMTSEELRRGLPLQQITDEQMRLWKEIEAQRASARETALRQEAMLQQLLRQKDPSATDTAEWETVSAEMRCKCGEIMERLQVKKDGAMKGRHYYQCTQRTVEAVLREEAMSVVSSERPVPVRAKSPRSAQLVRIFDDDEI